MVFKPKYDPFASQGIFLKGRGYLFLDFVILTISLWVLVNFVTGLFCDILCCSGIIISRPSSFSEVF